MQFRSVHRRPPPFTTDTADQPERPQESAGVHHRSLRTVTSLVTSHPPRCRASRKPRQNTGLLPGQTAHAPRLRRRALPACRASPTGARESVRPHLNRAEQPTGIPAAGNCPPGRHHPAIAWTHPGTTGPCATAGRAGSGAVMREPDAIPERPSCCGQCTPARASRTSAAQSAWLPRQRAGPGMIALLYAWSQADIHDHAHPARSVLVASAYAGGTAKCGRDPLLTEGTRRPGSAGAGHRAGREVRFACRYTSRGGWSRWCHTVSCASRGQGCSWCG